MSHLFVHIVMSRYQKVEPWSEIIVHFAFALNIWTLFRVIDPQIVAVSLFRLVLKTQVPNGGYCIPVPFVTTRTVCVLIRTISLNGFRENEKDGKKGFRMD